MKAAKFLSEKMKGGRVFGQEPILLCQRRLGAPFEKILHQGHLRRPAYCPQTDRTEVTYLNDDYRQVPERLRVTTPRAWRWPQLAPSLWSQDQQFNKRSQCLVLLVGRKDLDLDVDLD